MSSAGTSECDTSDYSNSPSSYTVKSPSPFGSPSQQVPQLANDLIGLSCNEAYFANVAEGPRLIIIDQPQKHFRFRYVSEMVGTHGCLLAESNTQSGKTKAHPTVELLNYSGRAIIRCSLAQHNNEYEHPHKLLEDEKDKDVKAVVPENGSYKVSFAGMGIIHTAKKVVPGLLFEKFSAQMKNTNFNIKELRAHCDQLAKNIELNIVRLKFSAHDIKTGKEICAPVFSEPIHNMKSAATNDLKICRISRYTGRPRGGEDVYIFVEKVNKKNIMIRFYELDANGFEVWSDKGSFLLSDVHHQYGIVFRTPPYKDPQTPVDVKVYIELVRPSDGRTSEPKEFTYKAEEVYRQIKKRKNNSSCSSLDSSSSGSISNLLPTNMECNIMNDVKREPELPIVTLPQSPVLQTSMSTQCGLGSALGALSQQTQPVMWSGVQQTVENNTSMPQLILNSTELDEIISRFTPEDMSKYSSFFESVEMPDASNEEPSAMGFIKLVPDSGLKTFTQSMLVADSGRPIKEEPSSSNSPEKASSRASSTQESSEALEYSAVFKPEDGLEVKKLVKELCDIIRDKKAYKSQDVKSKLERLFEIRLSNGDTFLHMTLFSNLTSFQSIVKVIHQGNMSHLLNYTNNKQQTILHLAVLYRSPSLVSFLVSKGCNPMLKDSEDDNAIHYALKYNQPCLDPLLDAMKKHNVKFDYNDYNSEKQTSMHVAASVGSASAIRSLVAAGWGAARGGAVRSPLHLAALDARRDALEELLKHLPQSEVDAVDSYGNTALQIVCGSAFNQHSVEMVKLLLEHKADPLKHEDHNESAWKLASDKPQIREVMKDYVPYYIAIEDDVKSEPEDEYESADEDMSEKGLSSLPLYINEVSAIVDREGAWRTLAERLQLTSLVEWFAARPSPTYTMLMHMKELSDDRTSKSLALILEDMGLIEAATIIRKAIE